MGAINIDVPYYPGSLKNQNRTLPLFWPIYRGEYFRLDQEGTRAKLTNKELYEIGISAGFSFPIKNNDVNVREGMNDINYVIEIGPRFIYRIISNSSWHKLNFNLSLRSAFEVNEKNLRSKNIGISGGPNFSYWIYLNKDKSASLFTNFGILYGDKKYNNFYYGVSAQYETTSRLPYLAEEGEISKRIFSRVAFNLHRDLQIFFGGFYSKIGGSRNIRSPLIETTTNSGFAIGFLWNIYKSEKIVSVFKKE